MNRLRAQAGRRLRQVRDYLKREDGLDYLADSARAKLSELLAPKQTRIPVLKKDVLAADLSRAAEVRSLAVLPGEPIVINWVTTPAGPRSGGHSTIFRIIRYLESQGFINRIYLYNVARADQTYYVSIMRDFYRFHGYVADIEQGMQDAHAVFATSWPTAYPAYNALCAGKRFYFVQDYEPYFHPVGSLSALAEQTYVMGFHAVTAGRWLSEKLRRDFRARADHFEFGCDIAQYRRDEASKRRGVVFYAKPDVSRRGYELGLMALELFAKRNPETEIHFYGDKVGATPFPCIDHGRVAPSELNKIYNICYAGLSLSMTNTSLVPFEMLAAGCLPVVNDADHNRAVLENPFVRYVPPYPGALAAELERVCRDTEFESLSRRAAESIHNYSWEESGAQVASIIKGALAGAEIGHGENDNARSH